MWRNLQNFLDTTVYAGEKGIPDNVKQIFSPTPVDQDRQQSLFNDVDRILMRHYGFTDEELDFIINYDVAYRKGQGVPEGGE